MRYRVGMDKPMLSRFMALITVDTDSGCWNWIGCGAGGSKAKGYYGSFYYKGTKGYTHRLSYEHFKGPIPDGLQIDHLCRNRRCCNPAHLEAVTPRVNVGRGERPTSTHCPNGHEFTSDNTYLTPTGHRRCVQCRKDQLKENYLKNREKRIQKERDKYWANPEKYRAISSERYRRKVRQT